MVAKLSKPVWMDWASIFLRILRETKEGGSGKAEACVYDSVSPVYFLILLNKV